MKLGVSTARDKHTLKREQELAQRPLLTMATFLGSKSASEGGSLSKGWHSSPRRRLNASCRPLMTISTGGCNQSNPAGNGVLFANLQLSGLYSKKLFGSAPATICFTMSWASGPSRVSVSRPAWGSVVDLGPAIYGFVSVSSKLLYLKYELTMR